MRRYNGCGPVYSRLCRRCPADSGRQGPAGAEALCDGLGACLGDCPQGALPWRNGKLRPSIQNWLLPSHQEQSTKESGTVPGETGIKLDGHGSGCPGLRSLTIHHRQEQEQGEAAPGLAGLRSRDKPQIRAGPLACTAVTAFANCPLPEGRSSLVVRRLCSLCLCRLP